MARTARWIPAMMVVGLFFVPVSGAAQEAFALSELTEMPSIKSPRQAQRVIARSYPRALEQAGVAGSAQIQFIVDADGKVSSASVEVIGASSKAFGDAAAKAISDIEFVPGKKDGSAVASIVVMPIRYQIG
jgi:TonB family protein